MIHPTLRTQIACDVDEFWALQLNDDFNRRYFLEGCKYHDYRLIEHTETETTVRRRFYLSPKAAQLPAPIVKVLGVGDPSVVEDGTFDKATRRYTARWAPASLPDRLTLAGRIYCEPADTGRIDRIAELDVDVRLFGIGWLIEREIVADFRRGFETLARFVEGEKRRA
jgi:hypothetical protein